MVPPRRKRRSAPDDEPIGIEELLEHWPRETNAGGGTTRQRPEAPRPGRHRAIRPDRCHRTHERQAGSLTGFGQPTIADRRGVISMVTPRSVPGDCLLAVGALVRLPTRSLRRPVRISGHRPNGPDLRTRRDTCVSSGAHTSADHRVRTSSPSRDVSQHRQSSRAAAGRCPARSRSSRCGRSCPRSAVTDLCTLADPGLLPDSRPRCEQGIRKDRRLTTDSGQNAHSRSLSGTLSSAT